MSNILKATSTIEFRNKTIDSNQNSVIDESTEKKKIHYVLKSTHELKNILLSITNIIEELDLIKIVDKKLKEGGSIQYLQALLNFGKILLDDVSSSAKDYSTMIQEEKEIEPYDLSEAIDFAYQMFFHRLKFEKRTEKIKILKEFNVNPNTKVNSINKTRLEQVLINLISNSYKFIQEGYIKISCNKTNEDKIRISVKDTAGGMTKNELEKLFNMFEVANNQERNKAGTGIGLCIVNDILKANNIKIIPTSKYLEGSTFSFDIDYIHDFYGEHNNNRGNSSDNFEEEFKIFPPLIPKDRVIHLDEINSKRFIDLLCSINSGDESAFEQFKPQIKVTTTITENPGHHKENSGSNPGLLYKSNNEKIKNKPKTESINPMGFPSSPLEKRSPDKKLTCSPFVLNKQLKDKIGDMSKSKNTGSCYQRFTTQAGPKKKPNNSESNKIEENKHSKYSKILNESSCNDDIDLKKEETDIFGKPVGRSKSFAEPFKINPSLMSLLNKKMDKYIFVCDDDYSLASGVKKLFTTQLKKKYQGDNAPIVQCYTDEIDCLYEIITYKKEQKNIVALLMDQNLKTSLGSDIFDFIKKMNFFNGILLYLMSADDLNDTFKNKYDGILLKGLDTKKVEKFLLENNYFLEDYSSPSDEL